MRSKKIQKPAKSKGSNSSLTVNESAVESTEIEGDEQAAEVLCNQLQHLSNTITPTLRHEIMEGRKYLVAPMVMITEGVHAGSNGPLYYPASELSKTPAVWNHKPIVVYHPTMNGQAISACEPSVISMRKVGLIMNTKYIPGTKGQPGKLKAEAWLEADRLTSVDPRVAKAVQNQLMMEVSTGLYTDNEQIDGTWKKKSYNAIARNYRADHLAILPDEKGACSIADGAGLMRNNTTKIGVFMNRESAIDAIIANSKSAWDEEDRPFLTKCKEDQFDKIAANAGITKKSDGLDYIDSNGDDGDNDTTPAADQVKAKKPGSKKSKVDNKKKMEEDDDDSDGKGVMNQQHFEPEELSVEEYINNAPAGMRDLLASGVKAHNQAKMQLVKAITSNKRCPWTPDDLMSRDLSELQGLASLAGVDKPTPVRNNYFGLGDAGSTQNDPTTNMEKVEPLGLPVFNYEKKA